MPNCSYCSSDYEIHKGLTLVLKDGAVKHLCSSKCRKNMLMKRRKVRWVSDPKKVKKVKRVKKVKKVKKTKKKKK